ncbi:MAG: thermonuclease family protein [Polyangiales bacterium]
MACVSNRRLAGLFSASLFAALVISGCLDGPAETVDPDVCGPSSATVVRVIDGDTVELDTGDRVRYLMIDAPENTSKKECYGAEATAANAAMVSGEVVSLTYDVECEDKYGRLLAYLRVGDTPVNETLVADGFACVLRIAPNGAERASTFNALQRVAKEDGRGLWGSCAEELPCGN